ncbi:MAG: monooxygenase [Ponticaulis sp.]|nr:monooxygenase [Ponticaulis sp.]
MKILIAGGGIAGLAASLALARDGHDIILFEQAAAINEVGAGLQISPNGMKVLRSLNLEEEVISAGFEPERIELRMGKSGAVIFDIPLADRSVDRWGARYIHIHRADLLNILLNEAEISDNIEIRLNHQLQQINTDGDEVELTLSGGRTERGDLLIGADGIHSVVRERLTGPRPPRFTGCVAWRGVIDVSRLTGAKPPPTACAWVGKGAHMVTYYLRSGQLVNLVGVIERSDWRTESWSERGMRDQFLSDFKGWHPTLQELIQKGDEFFQWALFDRTPLPKWVDGRVGLIGDACHPMLPFLAQGAVMALEDAYVLAKCLREEAAVETALQTYQGMRRARATQIQDQSRRNAGTFHRQSPLTQLATYGPMWLAGHALPEVVHQRMDWIYGHDVTA